MGHWAAVRDNIRIQTQTGPARHGYYAARLLATVWLFKTNVAQPILLVSEYYPPSHFSIFLHIQIKASIPLGLGCTQDHRIEPDNQTVQMQCTDDTFDVSKQS